MRALRLVACILASGCLSATYRPVFYVEADHTRYQFKEGLGHYEGHVRVSQGEHYFKAERMRTERQKSRHQFKQVVLFGTSSEPVIYEHHPKENLSTWAQAERMEYLPEQSMLRLIGHVTLHQKHQELKAEHVDYDIERGVARVIQGTTPLLLSLETS